MTVAKEIEAVILEVLNNYECDPVQITFRREQPGYVLRVLVERRGSGPEDGSGVDLGLCAGISRDVGTSLEVAGVIDKAYTLEVSSPGVERPLVRPEDYVRFTNRKISVKTQRAIDGRRKFKGILKDFRDEGVILTSSKGKDITIPINNVKKANLVFEPKGFGTNAGE